jgi:hypothetical protein
MLLLHKNLLELIFQIVPGAFTLADKAFSPNPIHVKVGDTLWTNNDSLFHTVTSEQALVIQIRAKNLIPDYQVLLP